MTPLPRLAAGDPELVRRAQRGELDAFEALYRAHEGRVHALCLRLTGDPQAARERLQDAFVQAWEKLPGFRGDSAFGTWLHRLAVNCCLMAHRGDRRREGRVAPVEDLADAEAAQWMTRAAEDPEGRIDLERAIAALPPALRAAFVLHELEGYRHEEIAALQGVATPTVRVQLHRARKLLMEVLDR